MGWYKASSSFTKELHAFPRLSFRPKIGKMFILPINSWLEIVWVIKTRSNLYFSLSLIPLGNFLFQFPVERKILSSDISPHQRNHRLENIEKIKQHYQVISLMGIFGKNNIKWRTLARWSNLGIQINWNEVWIPKLANIRRWTLAMVGHCGWFWAFKSTETRFEYQSWPSLFQTMNIGMVDTQHSFFFIFVVSIELI